MSLLTVEKGFLCIGLRTACLIIAYLRLFTNFALPILMIKNIFAVFVAAGLSGVIDDSNKWHFLFFFTAVAIVTFIYDVILIVGIHKNIRACVKTFILFSIFEIMSIFFMFSFALSRKAPIAVDVRYAILILVRLYCLLVIRSYYLKTEECQKPPPMIKA